MRVPNINLQRVTLEGIHANLREMERAARELSTGVRVATPSDDPAAARSILRANSALSANTQFLRNISLAGSLISLEDGVLDQLGDVLIRARELGIAEAGSTSNEATRAVAASEVEQLITFARDLGNTRLGDRYIFGGDDPSRAPFDPTADPPIPLPEGGSPVGIGVGRTIRPNVSAAEIFGEPGVMAALEGLAEALRNNDADAIGASVGALGAAHDGIQLVVGETGSRMNRLISAASGIEEQNLHLVESRSDQQDVEFEDAVTRLAMRQTAYQAALAATSRIIGINLTDYLR